MTAEPEMSSNVQFVAEQFRAPVPNLAIGDGAILWQAAQPRYELHRESLWKRGRERQAGNWPLSQGQPYQSAAVPIRRNVHE